MAAEHLNPLLTAALGYTAKGLQVFPVNERTKAPYTTHGMQDASSDEQQIVRWWTEHSHALIGCRIPQQYVVLDIDPRHGGLDVWQAVEQSYAAIPVERQHHSGRQDGGFHAWFKRPDGKLSTRRLKEWARSNNVGQSTGKRSWSIGIDILHYGHRYTILPPSPHPATGEPYEWDVEGKPDDMPGFLAAMCVAVPQPKAQPMRLVRDTDSVADWFTANHSWHDILPAAGWLLVDGDGDGDGSKWRHPNASAESSASVRHGCLFVYTPNTDFEVTEDNDPQGVTRFRAWAILEHDGDLSMAAREALALRDGALPPVTVITTPTDDGRPWLEPTPLGDARDRPSFPVDALPDWIAAHVRQVADEMQFPPDLPAQLAITALSIACAGYATVTVRGTWREPLNTFCVTAMPPGAGKSPALRQMLGCYDEWEAQLTAASAADRDNVDTQRAVLEKERTKHVNAGDLAKALMVGDQLRELPDSAVPRLMADDATPEKVVDMLREQGGRLAIVSTEGGVFSLMSGRYSDRANLDVYLQAWSGDTIRVDRIGRASSVVRNPALSVGLTVQPTVIADLADTPELSGRGLLARFMYSVPVDNVGRRDMARSASIDPSISTLYSTRMIRLAEEMRAHQTPIELHLTPQALDAFNVWHQEIEHRRGTRGDLRPMAEWTTKMVSTVARIAGLLAIAEQSPISGAVMDRAITIGRYWEAHARLAHDMWGADPVVARAGKVLDWLIENGLDEFTLRDTYKSAVRQMTPEDGADAVQLLVDNSWVRSVDGRPLVVGRRGVPSPAFRLHPDSSRFRNNHGLMGVMALKTHLEDSLSPCRDTGKDGTPAHDAHAPMTPKPESALEAVDNSDEPDPERFW